MSAAKPCEERVAQVVAATGYTVTHECGMPTRHPSRRCQRHRPKGAPPQGQVPHLAPLYGDPK